MKHLFSLYFHLAVVWYVLATNFPSPYVWMMFWWCSANSLIHLGIMFLTWAKTMKKIQETRKSVEAFNSALHKLKNSGGRKN